MKKLKGDFDYRPIPPIHLNFSRKKNARKPMGFWDPIYLS